MAQANFPTGQISPPAGIETEDGFYPRYLAAKKTIDDRALNRHVWETLRQALAQGTGGEPVQILEIGAGIGTMLERVVDWGLLKGPATYVATDSAESHLRAAKHHLTKWAAERGHVLAWSGEQGGLLRTANSEVFLVFDVVSCEELAGRKDTLGPFHLLLAHGVLDLVDFPVVLPPLMERLSTNGLASLTCNFDGETVFLPEYPGRAEEEVISLYHASMETRLPGASHTGRRLLAFLQRPGLEVLAAGSSDWVVHPRDGRYAMDEAFFLHAIIATVEQELAKSNSVPPSALTAWAGLRRRQIEAGELFFLARHLDLLARRRPSLP
jgi:hypothetical protein